MEILYTHEVFSNFALVFRVMRIRMKYHPLYDENIIRNIYEMAQYNPNVHTLTNAAKIKDGKLLRFIANYFDDSNVSEAIIEAAIHGNCENLEFLISFGYSYQDMIIPLDISIIFECVQVPIQCFKIIIENTFTDYNFGFEDEIIEHTARYGSAANLRYLIENYEGDISWLVPEAIMSNNIETMLCLFSEGVEPSSDFWELARTLGNVEICRYLKDIDPEIAEDGWSSDDGY